MQNNFQVCVYLMSKVYCMYSYQKVHRLVPFDFLSDLPFSFFCHQIKFCNLWFPAYNSLTKTF